MPQHMESNQTDGWGLSGASVQEHLSGWEPKDFGPEWSFYVCDDFHQVDFKGDRLQSTHGAFFAIRNFDPANIAPPATNTDLRRKLPSEIEAAELRRKVAVLSTSMRNLETAYNGLLNSRAVRLTSRIKALLNMGRT
jgi:hypothetical protein